VDLVLGRCSRGGKRLPICTRSVQFILPGASSVRSLLARNLLITSGACNRTAEPADGWATTPVVTAGVSLSRPGRTCVTPLSFSPLSLSNFAHTHRHTPSTRSRTSPLRKRRSCSAGSSYSGQSSLGRRTSTRSCGHAQPRPLRCSGPVPVVMSVLRCHACMSSGIA
jgi:hypothetical protein